MARPKHTMLEYRNYELPPDFPILVLTGERWHISPVPGIDEHVRIPERTVFHIIKADEAHTDREAGERFADMDQRIPVRLMKVPGKRPGAQRTPGMQHGDGHGELRRGAEGVQFLQMPESFGHSGNGLVEGVLPDGQMQVTAQADPVHTLAGQRPAHMQPVLLRVLFRMPAL